MNRRFCNQEMMPRRSAVGTSEFVAAIVVTAIVVAAVTFAAAPFRATVTSTIPASTTTVTGPTSTMTSTSTVTGPTTTITVTSTASEATTTSSQQSATTSVQCSISGQPDAFYLRVVSDSNQTPIAGAQVTATNEPYCVSTQSTLTFTTNTTEWYSLPSQNNAGYSFAVEYSGQTYDFTASLRPISVTCESLYIPSGLTNATIIAGQSSCPSTIMTTSTDYTITSTQ